MPDDLAAELKRASPTILKGDLNDRSLVGDRDLSLTTGHGEHA